MNEQEILGLEDKRFAAMIAEDFGTLEALTHDELVYTHGHGGRDSKASWIETMRSGKTHYRKIVPGERKVRLFGDVALVTGRLDYELESAGQPRSLKFVFLAVWAKTPQGWQFVAWQTTPRPA
jgi:ketosteroid isomerase-like protein